MPQTGTARCPVPLLLMPETQPPYTKTLMEARADIGAYGGPKADISTLALHISTDPTLPQWHRPLYDHLGRYQYRFDRF